MGYDQATGLPTDCIPSDGSLIAKSDVLIVRFADPDGWVLTSQLGDTSLDSNGVYYVRAKPPGKAVLFDAEISGDVTTATTDGSDGISGTDTSDGVFNYQYAFMEFCVENVTSGGTTVPELLVLRSTKAGMTSQMLAEGVEALKFEYGIDANDTSGQYDYQVGQWLSAADVTDWSKVLAVRVSMVVRGDALGNYVDSQTYNLTPSFCYGPAGKGCDATYDSTAARYQRRLMTQVIQIRNRMRS